MSNILNSIASAVQKFANINNQKKQREYQNKLATKQFNLLQKESAEKQDSRTRARNAFALADNRLNNLKTYALDDIYKKINFGKGKDSLNRYQVGPQLKQKLVTDSAFNNLTKNNLIQKNQRKNINFLSQLRDKGFTAVDKDQLNKILKTQRDENKTLKNTLTRRAIEQGFNPSRARLTQSLLSAQSAANRNNNLFSSLASDAATRRRSATKDLQNILNHSFDQSAQIAAANDNIALKNTDIQNQKNLLNHQRATRINDLNKKLHNENILRNAHNQNQAKREVIDSHNDKQKIRGEIAARKAQTFFKY